jgi:NADPH:quinone reductase-like Zn-dependent oxidoreductase
VAKKPTSMSFEDAATLPVSYVTATGAIYQGLNIPLPYLEGGKEEGFKPSSILVCGGSSSVGAMAVQLLRLALPKAQIFATASKQHHHTVKSLGADQVFDHSSPSLVEELKKASPSGEGVDAILDAVNGVAVNPSLFEVLTGPKAFAEVITGRNVKKAPDGVKHSPVFGAAVFSQPGGSNVFAAFERLLAEGKLKLPTAVKVVGHGLESISGGLEELRAGVSGTKLVVSL